MANDAPTHAEAGERQDPAHDWRSHDLIFVCGLHRSGTTFLGRCLADHPQVSGLSNTGGWEDEGQHVQTVYPRGLVFGGPGRFAFAPEAHLTEASPRASSASADLLFRQWMPYWDLSKPALVEKSPPNLIRTRFLQALYPGAAFVVITRHPVAVSLSTRKWKPENTLSSLFHHWMTAHRIFEQDRQHLARVMVVAYEHLIARPQACLDSIYGFLGLPRHALAIEARADANDAHFEQWRGLPAAERDALDERFGDDVAAFGYRLRDPDRVLQPR